MANANHKTGAAPARRDGLEEETAYNPPPSLPLQIFLSARFW